VMMGDVLGVEVRRELYVKDDAERGEVIGGFTFDGETKWMVGDPSEIVSRQLDYLDLTSLAWYRGEDGWLSLGLGKSEDQIERTLAVSPPDDDGLVTLWKLGKPEGSWRWIAKADAPRAFEDVSEAAEQIVMRYGAAVLWSKEKRWRNSRASAAQIGFAVKLGIEGAEKMTKGEVAQRITHVLAMRALR
jgi:hypothetical protein